MATNTLDVVLYRLCGGSLIELGHCGQSVFLLAKCCRSLRYMVKNQAAHYIRSTMAVYESRVLAMKNTPNCHRIIQDALAGDALAFNALGAPLISEDVVHSMYRPLVMLGLMKLYGMKPLDFVAVQPSFRNMSALTVSPTRPLDSYQDLVDQFGQAVLDTAHPFHGKKTPTKFCYGLPLRDHPAYMIARLFQLYFSPYQRQDGNGTVEQLYTLVYGWALHSDALDQCVSFLLFLLTHMNLRGAYHHPSYKQMEWLLADKLARHHLVALILALLDVETSVVPAGSRPISMAMFFEHVRAFYMPNAETTAPVLQFVCPPTLFESHAILTDAVVLRPDLLENTVPYRSVTGQVYLSIPIHTMYDKAEHLKSLVTYYKNAKKKNSQD